VSDRWSVIGAVYNEETAEMVNLIKNKTGCEPKFFATYSTMLAFVRHAGLDENHPMAYKNGQYMGDLDKLTEILK
jgi:hypothetical protein